MLGVLCVPCSSASEPPCVSGQLSILSVEVKNSDWRPAVNTTLQLQRPSSHHCGEWKIYSKTKSGRWDEEDGLVGDVRRTCSSQ